MPIPVTCGHCHKSFKASDSAAGRKSKCPSCGGLIEIPAVAAAGEAPPHADAAHPADALAAALGHGPADAAPPQAKPAAHAVKPAAVRPEPVEAQPAVHVPTAPAAPATEYPATASDEDEMITVPPIGVQTPSGLVIGHRAQARQMHRLQRKMAGWARILGAGLGGLCLAVGITGMIYLALATRKLPTALGVFLLMLILSGAMFSAGLLARHLLLMLADVGESLARQQDTLDEINERLS